jgi:hypothetical protein
VAGTIITLAFAAKASLGSFARSDQQEIETFEVEAGGDRDFSVRITSIVDGRALPFASMDHEGSWSAGNARQVLHGPTPDGRGPSLLRFRGRELVLAVEGLAGSGFVGLSRGGASVVTMDPVTAGTGRRRLAFESPSSSSGWPALALTLLLCTACAWWFGPIRAGRESMAWLVFYLSAFHLLVWVNQCVGSTNDSHAYVRAYAEIVRGEPAYFPPGYPVFVGLVGSLAGDSLGRYVTMIQHGMIVAASAWIYLLLRRFVPEPVAFLAGIVAGALSPAPTLAQSVMSEAPTLFAMVGALYFAVRSVETEHWFPALVAGLLAGWAGLLRVVPLAGLVPAMGVIQGLSARSRRLRRVGITLAVTCAMIAFPLMWFGRRSGRLLLTDSAGFHLFNRVVNEQRQLDDDGPSTRILLGLLEDRSPRGVDVWRIVEQVERRSGMTESQIESLLGEVAREAIRKDPWAYLFFTPSLAVRIMLDGSLGEWILAWGETGVVHPRLETPPPLGLTASGLIWRWTLEDIYRRAWPKICLLAIGGVILGAVHPHRLPILALACLPAGYLLATAAAEFHCPRYNVPVMPFIVALAAVPLGSVYERAVRSAHASSQESA